MKKLIRLIPVGSLTLGLTTLTSYAFGLLRDRVFAQTFGASRALDAYNAAFLIPDLLFNILIASGIAAAFVPIFTELFYSDKKKVESTLLDFPLNLKIRSERLNNVSAYLLVGGKFSLDLASQAKTQNPEIVKLTNKDYCFEAGFGFDFYLVYFKLSTELKFSAGLKDRLYHENTTYSSPIDKLFSKCWLFSLNFEG